MYLFLLCSRLHGHFLLEIRWLISTWGWTCLKQSFWSPPAPHLTCSSLHTSEANHTHPAHYTGPKLWHPPWLLSLEHHTGPFSRPCLFFSVWILHFSSPAPKPTVSCRIALLASHHEFLHQASPSYNPFPLRSELFKPVSSLTFCLMPPREWGELIISTSWANPSSPTLYPLLTGSFALGLRTCCSLVPECSSSGSSHGWLGLILQVSMATFS